MGQGLCLHQCYPPLPVVQDLVPKKQQKHLLEPTECVTHIQQ